jgi:hypothetical protein
MRPLSAMSLTRPTDTRQSEPDADNWRTEALCREIPVTGDWDPWYPDKDSTSHTYNEAREICGRCPIAQMCLAQAMDEERGLPQGVRHGMRGGLTPAQRTKLDRGAAKPRRVGMACADRRGTEAGYDRHRRAGEKACIECKAGHAKARLQRAHERDAKILELVAAGLTQKAIARELEVARSTVNLVLARQRDAS